MSPPGWEPYVHSCTCSATRLFSRSDVFQLFFYVGTGTCASFCHPYTLLRTCHSPALRCPSSTFFPLRAGSGPLPTLWGSLPSGFHPDQLMKGTDRDQRTSGERSHSVHCPLLALALAVGAAVLLCGRCSCWLASPPQPALAGLQ